MSTATFHAFYHTAETVGMNLSLFYCKKLRLVRFAITHTSMTATTPAKWREHEPKNMAGKRAHDIRNVSGKRLFRLLRSALLAPLSVHGDAALV